VSVAVGKGEGVKVADGKVGATVDEGTMMAGVGSLCEEQAKHPPKSMSSIATCFIA